VPLEQLSEQPAGLLLVVAFVALERHADAELLGDLAGLLLAGGELLGGLAALGRAWDGAELRFGFGVRLRASRAGPAERQSSSLAPDLVEAVLRGRPDRPRGG
jgi:hypothetical protein